MRVGGGCEGIEIGQVNPRFFELHGQRFIRHSKVQCYSRVTRRSALQTRGTIFRLAKKLLQYNHCLMPKRSSKKPVKKKNPAAVALGRLGGLKGGKARMATLSPKERKELAIKAISARWKKAKNQ